MESISKISGVKRWLGQTNTVLFTLYTALAAFCLYTCVYAFRKSFSAATFEGIQYLNIDFKIWLVMFQVMGYAASKFAGIKIISELKAQSRAVGILLMVAIAGISWLLFALVPAPYNIIFLFTNGFPLGLVWGMVFGYLEGRRNTDVLGAALAVSFIFSAGFCRSVGGFIIRDWHVSETWMPLTAGLLFVIPLLIFLWLLDQVPPPSAHDEALRTKRQPMLPAERLAFARTFFWGLMAIVLLYALLTTFREFRDNFSADVWKSLGYGNSPAIYTTTEIPVSIICLVVIGSLVLIRNNRIALQVIHLLILAGTILVGVATYSFQHGWIEAPLWMTLNGIGLYLGYIPFNSSFFDRLLATFKVTGTVGFVMYLADSIGYLGSIPVLLYKTFGQRQLSWLEFFMSGAYVVSILGSVLVIGSMVYFHRKSRRLDHGTLTIH
jgi:MFS family permease